MTDLTIIYDGECPLCSSYVRMLRLRARVGTVSLVDARSGDASVGAARQAGLDLNAGMVAIWQDKTFYGADAMHLLTMLTAPDGISGRLQRAVFGTPERAARLYPVLVRGRMALLRLMGRKSISADSAKRFRPRE